MTRRRKDETCGTEAMFDVATLVTSRDETSRTKAPKSASFAICPRCNRRGKRNESINTGLIRQGSHLVWRPHTIVTWKGTRRPCLASGTAVCDNPPRDGSVGCTCEPDD